MSRAPTLAEVDSLASYLASTIGARIVSRQHAVEYQMIRAALLAVSGGVLDVEKLLEGYSTAIGPLIYLSPALDADPVKKAAIIVHECEHVGQFYRGDVFGYAWLYLTEPEARATYEAHAYASQMELETALTGVVPALESLTWPLEGGLYNLGPEHKQLARQILAARATGIATGTVGGLCAQLAISWFRKNAPDCLAAK